MQKLDQSCTEALLNFAKERDKHNYLNESYFFGDLQFEGTDINFLLESWSSHCISVEQLNLESLLSRACFLGNTRIVEICLRADTRPDIQDGGGRCALHAAVAGGHASIVQQLIAAVPLEEKYHFVNQCDLKEWTPLHIAVCRQYAHIVNILLENQADPKLDLSHSFPPCRISPAHSACIHFAAMKSNREIFDLLLKAGASVDDRDEAERIPLHYSVSQTSSVAEFVEYLISLNPETVHTTDCFGLTPLHCAATRGHTRICMILVQHGSNISARDQWDLLPVDYAILHQHTNLTSLLSLPSSPSVDETLHRDRLVDILSTQMKEDNVDQLKRTIQRLGDQKCLEIFMEVLKIEARGGQLVSDQTRKRTLGGIFFRLIRELVGKQITPEDWLYITYTTREKNKLRRRQHIQSLLNKAQIKLA